MEDYVLVALNYENTKDVIHFLGKILSVYDERAEYDISFLRLKGPLIKDKFIYPKIEDRMEIKKNKVLGVVAASKGATARQANIIVVNPPLTYFNIR